MSSAIIIIKSTNVYACKLDATEAFDRLHYGQLFIVLQKINLPAIAICLLLDMYTRQSTCILWNGTRALPFNTQNEVGQGDILIPILFCVYIDELFSIIMKYGYGCHICHLPYAVFEYVDDVKKQKKQYT